MSQRQLQRVVKASFRPRAAILSKVSRPRLLASQLHQHSSLPTTRGTDLDHAFFTHRLSAQSTKDGPDPADVGRTIQILTTRLPHILKDGVLPADILSDAITLELLPTTLGLPEIKGAIAYGTLSRLAAWSVTTLFPKAAMRIDSQRLVGSARRCECLMVRFRVVDGAETIYTGLFHFHFDASTGKIARHVFEVVDGRFTPAHLVGWIMGRKQEKSLGYCYQNYQRRS